MVDIPESKQLYQKGTLDVAVKLTNPAIRELYQVLCHFFNS